MSLNGADFRKGAVPLPCSRGQEKTCSFVHLTQGNAVYLPPKSPPAAGDPLPALPMAAGQSQHFLTAVFFPGGDDERVGKNSI